MPFGLTNAPVVFQHMMNDIFREYLDQFVVVYLDDILIFSRDSIEHNRHVRTILSKLHEYRLYAKREKYEFHQTLVDFLGYVILFGGLKMDKKKVTLVQEWKVLAKVKDVQSFLGFANVYHRFIRGFCTWAELLLSLTRKDSFFSWTPIA
jgi:hypothetical protein